MELFKNKTGELTTQQIVMLIILIVSFIVILYFIFFLNLGKTTDKEICHNSVVTRGSTVLSADTIPLKCKTTNLCISEDNSCERMTNPEIKKVGKEIETYNLLAESMVDCWWMFGEGKVDYVGKDWQPNRYCSICNRVVFDDSVKKVFASGQIDKKDFYDYLAANKVSGKNVTYLEYLFGAQKVSDLHAGTGQGDNFGTIDLSKTYYIAMAIDSKIDFKRYGAAAGVIVGIGIAASPFTGGASAVGAVAILKGVMFVSSVAGLGAVAGYYVGNVVEGESGNNYVAPTIVEANSKIFDGLGCKEVSTIS